MAFMAPFVLCACSMSLEEACGQRHRECLSTLSSLQDPVAAVMAEAVTDSGLREKEDYSGM